MGTILTDPPNDHRDSSDLASPPLPGHVAAPVRRALGISRIGYAVGALVVIAGATAILFTGALSPSAPATPVKVEPANIAALPQGSGIDQGASPDMAAVNLATASTAALPPMSNSMGMWDFVTVPQPALSAPPRSDLDPEYWHFVTTIQQPLSPMENDERYWDPNWIPLQPVSSTAECATQLACRESHAATIQAPTPSVVAAPPSSFGTFDFSTYHPTAGIPAQSSDSASTLQCPTVLVTCRSSNGAQVPAPSSTLPPMSNDMGYWDRIQPPTQPNYWDRGQTPTQPAPKSSTNVLYGDAAIYRTSAP